jgi:hypothetical protein
MNHATLLSLGLCLLFGSVAAAQEPLVSVPDPTPLWNAPPDSFNSLDRLNRRDQRIRLPRFQPGFLADPVNVFPDTTTTDPTQPADDSADWLNLAMGNDNPFTDFRRPGSAGGLGYYRMMGQVQLLDSGSTGFALNLNAVTPAGRQMDGVEYGVTVFTPSLAVYQELMTGTALHGFVGTNLSVNGLPTAFTSPGQVVSSPVEYGIALQHPLLLPETDVDGGLYFYVGAIGRVTDPRDLPPLAARQPTLEVLPGLHWQLDSKTWLTGALIVPVSRGTTTPTQTNQPLWQLTCQFRF